MKVHKNEFKDVMPTWEILRVSKERERGILFCIQKIPMQFLCDRNAVSMGQSHAWHTCNQYEMMFQLRVKVANASKSNHCRLVTSPRMYQLYRK